MKSHIIVTAANGAECLVFTDHISVIIKATQSEGCFIYTGSAESTIRTKETYEQVIELIRNAAQV
jgi:hypothetical protein